MPVDAFGQNHLLHSIELQHYKKRMKYMFSAAQSHQMDAMVTNYVIWTLISNMLFVILVHLGDGISQKSLETLIILSEPCSIQ